VAVRGLDAYRAAFVARCELTRSPGQLELDERGICGLLPSVEHPSCRLLIADDRAYDVLAALLPEAKAGRINVFTTAARCADLRCVRVLTLPPELTLRAVRRTADEPRDGVPLEAAVAAVLRANPSTDDSPDTLADYLRSLPPATRLLCALDEEGAVRATSGSTTLGTEARVFFVNTDPDWRGRGIGQAMTVAALQASRSSGARRACLDASDAGQSIYLRLGFDVVSRTTRFFRGRDRA
jgi:ribosomal protein S18 acetylase RimI-like enzyme